MTHVSGSTLMLRRYQAGTFENALEIYTLAVTYRREPRPGPDVQA